MEQETNMTNTDKTYTVREFKMSATLNAVLGLVLGFGLGLLVGQGI